MSAGFDFNEQRERVYGNNQYHDAVEGWFTCFGTGRCFFCNSLSYWCKL